MMAIAHFLGNYRIYVVHLLSPNVACISKIPSLTVLRVIWFVVLRSTYSKVTFAHSRTVGIAVNEILESTVRNSFRASPRASYKTH